MLTETGFDSSKYYLGVLCKRGHEWELGIGQSLRRKSDRACIGCNKFKNTTPLGEPVGELYILGRLCLHNHDYENTGKSLRHRKGGKCVKCSNSRSKKYDEKNRDKILQYKLIYQENNRENILLSRAAFREKNREILSLRTSEYIRRNYEQVQIRRKEFYRKNSERLNAGSRKRYSDNKEEIRKRRFVYRQQNKDKISASYKRWRLTPEGKLAGRRAYAKREASRRNNYRVPYTPEEMVQRVGEFDGLCAYCGKTPEILTIDHFIPVRFGGPDTLQNLLPCCSFCNSSKSTKDPYEWFVSTPFYSKKRWQLILKTLGKTQDNYLQLPLF